MALSNIQGLQGLTAADRQKWENQQLQTLGIGFADYTEDQKDRLYRNQMFKETFGGDGNYKELIKMPPEERDRYYADRAFHDAYKDNMSVEDMTKLSAIDRDAQYNYQYAFDQAKSLYGDTDVWKKVARTDEDGNEYSLFETETLQELVRSGIKPESEIQDYERAGILGNTYSSGQKKRADSDLALMGGENTASNVFTRIKKATLGAVVGIGAGIGDLVWNKTIKPGIMLTGDLFSEGDIIDDGLTKFTKAYKEGTSKSAFDVAKEAAASYERGWLRETNEDAWAELQQADYDRKMAIGKEYVDAMAEQLHAQATYGGDEGRAELDKQFNNLMENSPYFRQFKDTKYLRNLTYAEKAKMAAEAMYMLGQYGPETYANYTNDNVRNFIADSMNAGDRMAHGAYDVFAQAVGGLAGAIIGQESIATGILDAASGYDSDTFRQGFKANGKEQLYFLWNPVYWNSISQFGTMDPDEIKRIKYGVGEKQYQEYAAQKKEENPNLSDQDIEDMWIKEQWDEGRFRGDQISEHVNVYKTTEENDAIGLSTFYGALGMSGQVLSQFLLGRGVGWIGNMLRDGATAMKMSRVASGINAATPYAQIMYPTLPIAEAYAQGAYEKTIQKNREMLEGYIQSEEGQQKVNERFEANKEQYMNTALEEIVANYVAAKGSISDDELKGIEQSSDLEKYAMSLAAEDERKQFYGHLDEGAKAAFWTSFALEGIRYGVFNMFNRQWIFGDASRKIRGAGPEVKMTAQGAQPAVSGTWATVKDVAKNAAKEMWNSGRTNYCDELTTGFAVGFGSNLPTDYMGRIRQNNPEFDGVYGALLNGFNNLVDVADDPTSIQAFTTGALGFLVGGNAANIATAWAIPSIRAEYSEAEKLERIKQGLAEGLSYADAQQRANMSAKEARELFKQKLGLAENDYSIGRHVLEWASYLTGNSALQNVSERLQRLDDATRVANRINAQLANDEQDLDNDRIIREMASLVAAREAASISGDEMTKKNENYKDVFHALKTLQNMRDRGEQDTAIYENFMETMRGYAEGRITEDDVQSFLHNPENEAYVNSLGNKEQQAEYAKERIQKNAEKFLEVNESWQRNKTVIDSTIGDLSKSTDTNAQDAYYDLLFKMSWSEDANQRLESMEESISGLKEASDTETPMIQRLIATVGGSQEFVQGLQEEVQQHIEELKDRLVHQKRHINFISKNKRTKAGTVQKQQKEADKIQSEIDRFSKLLDKYNETLSRYKEVTSEESIANESTTPLRAEELLRLNPEERLFVFTHPEAFSKKQQVQIEKARTQLLKQMGSDYLTTMRDTHVLGQRVALNDEYIARALTGENLQEVLDAMQQVKVNEVVKTIQWLAGEKLKSIVPLIGKKVTKKLLSALVGAPLEDIAKYAPYIGDPAKIAVLTNALGILRKLREFDAAINLSFDSPTERKHATDLMERIFFGSKDFIDIWNRLQDAISDDNTAYTKEDKEIIEKVLNKQVELTSQQDATKNKGVDEVEEEAKVETKADEDKKQLSLEDKIMESHADHNTGEYQSLTNEELDQVYPDVAPNSNNNSGNTEQLGAVEAVPVNIQGTTLQGNWINAYDVNALKETGKQVTKKGQKADDVFQRWLDWTAQNSYRLQDIVDFELAKIVADNPEIPVHMLVVKGDENVTKDNLIRDAIMLAIEATDAVKKLHNEEYGHYVQSNGKEYLIIGRTGIEKVHTDEQEANYKAMHDAIQVEKKDFFDKNESERFYVSDKYTTQVRYINGGNITKALVGEQEGLHNIADMLGDTARDPFGIKKLDNLGWYIQVGTQAKEPIGLPMSVVRNGDYYTPADKEMNNGAVFAMVPTGNGKYMPIKIQPATLASIKDGAFKDAVKAVAQRLTTPDYEARENAIKEMCKLLVLNKTTNLLVGTKDIPAITIVQDGKPTRTLRLAEVSADDVVNAIMETPFRININKTTFMDDVRMKQLMDAGAFMTDAAVLGGTGNNFTVYSMDAEGNIQKETSNIGNEGYTPKNVTTATVNYKGATARLKGGKWVVEELGKESRVVTSPSEKLALDCAAQIQEQGLTPVESKNGYDYFILNSDVNNPLVVKKSRPTGEIVVPSRNAMVEYIERNTKNAQAIAAKAELDARNQEAEAKGKQMFIDISNLDKENPVQVEEKVQENTKNVVKNLHKSEKNFTFAELYGNFQYWEDIDTALVALAERTGDTFDGKPTTQWLQKHGIPTVGIESAEALIDLINNCR